MTRHGRFLKFTRLPVSLLVDRIFQVIFCLLTGEVSQHRCQRNSEEDQCDRETLPGASVLAPFVDVKTWRRIRWIMRHRCSAKWKSWHYHGLTLGAHRACTTIPSGCTQTTTQRTDCHLLLRRRKPVIETAKNQHYYFANWHCISKLICVSYNFSLYQIFAWVPFL